MKKAKAGRSARKRKAAVKKPAVKKAAVKRPAVKKAAKQPAQRPVAKRSPAEGRANRVPARRPSPRAAAVPASHPLELVATATRGRWLSQAGVRTARFFGAAVDSRTAGPDQLFFAIKGERVDGFDFCAQAAQAGAAALVVARGRGLPAGVGRTPVLAVDDPVRALGQLAHAVRRRFSGTVIGVTGSNGKTTTKELIARALSAHGTVLRSPGNLNTEVGLPQAILAARGDESFWVLELAMRGPGQIDYLGRIARPHVAVVTNIGAAHLERLGSLEAIARAKGEIYGTLGPRGKAVVPANEARLADSIRGLAPSRVFRFGAGAAHAFARAEDMPPVVRLMDFVPQRGGGALLRISVGDYPALVRLPLSGRHNALNACAAMAVVEALGLPIAPAAAALATVDLPAHRSSLREVGGRTVIDDCYNANPTSMSAALLALMEAAPAGRAFAILGDMLELGDEAPAFHEALGREAAACGVYALVAVGAHAPRLARGARSGGVPVERILQVGGADSGGEKAARIEAATRQLAALTRPGDAILVKASRGMRLEVAVQALYKALT